MFFEYSLTVPAGRAEAEPVEAEMALAPGIVNQVAVQFLSGCVGEVHVSIWRGEHQVWPVNLDGDIAGENNVVAWVEAYPLDDEPFEMIVKGWAPNTSYDHTVTVRFAVLPVSLLEAAEESRSLLQRIAKALFGG